MNNAAMNIYVLQALWHPLQYFCLENPMDIMEARARPPDVQAVEEEEEMDPPDSASRVFCSRILSMVNADDVSAIIHQSEYATAAGHNRWLLWTETWKYIIKKPLLGYGCEGLSDVLMDSLGRANPHNEVLAYAAQFGIPAAVFYTLSIIALLTRPFLKHKNAETKNGVSMDGSCCAGLLAAFGYFISSLFGVTMFYTLPFFFIFLGLSVPDDDDYFPHLAL